MWSHYNHFRAYPNFLDCYMKRSLNFYMSRSFESKMCWCRLRKAIPGTCIMSIMVQLQKDTVKSPLYHIWTKINLLWLKVFCIEVEQQLYQDIHITINQVISLLLVLNKFYVYFLWWSTNLNIFNFKNELKFIFFKVFFRFSQY